MSNIWKIAISLTLVLCLAVAFISCSGDKASGDLQTADMNGESQNVNYVTDENGETILDENGNPVTEESQTFPYPIESDTGDDFGKIYYPTNRK